MQTTQIAFRPATGNPVERTASFFSAIHREEVSSLSPAGSARHPPPTSAGLFLPATPTLKATAKPPKGSSAPRARKPFPQSSALRLCRPPLTLRPFHSASLHCKGGETPQLAVATPRLRQVAFGMYVTCHCHNNGKSNHREEAPMSKKAPATTKPSIYQIVTDRIIASLKAGVIPWEKPWQTPHFAGGPFPETSARVSPIAVSTSCFCGLAVIIRHSGLRSIKPES